MLDRLLSPLPESVRTRAKGIVAALGAVVGLLTLVIDGEPDWLTKAVLVATALGVYVTPNLGYTNEVRPRRETIEWEPEQTATGHRQWFDPARSVIVPADGREYEIDTWPHPPTATRSIVDGIRDPGLNDVES